jgi:hypothetical protein
MEKDIFSEMFHIENDLAPFRIKYRCYDDCRMSGCPGHEAEFAYRSVSETFTITWRLGEAGEHITSFDAVEFALIEDFMKRLKRKD